MTKPKTPVGISSVTTSTLCKRSQVIIYDFHGALRRGTRPTKAPCSTTSGTDRRNRGILSSPPARTTNKGLLYGDLYP